jgi:Outer membrane protein beta-barrel domain
MRKLLLPLFTIISFTGLAQTKIALHGGLNFNTIGWKDKDDRNTQSDSIDYTYSSKSGKQGFHVGLSFDIHTEENWYFETGLTITKKGGKTEENTKLTPSGVAFNRTQFFSPTYLQFPFYLLYMPESKKRYKVTAGIGVHLGIGVGGSYESTTTIGSNATVRVSRKAAFGIDLEDDFKPIELGMGAKVGFLMNDNIFFNLSYQRSFINNAPKTKEQFGSAVHNVIGLSIGKYIKR